jgi:putative transposase
VRRKILRLYTFFCMLAAKPSLVQETHYQGKYRIDSARLADYDYGSNGIYFVTICTRNRHCYFGDIAENADGFGLQPTPMGQQAIDCWLAIPAHFPFVVLDEFQVMPNHLHGILCIDKPNYNDWQPNVFGPQSQNLASILRGYKAGVTTFSTKEHIEFGWQARYHDRVVRNENELNRIRKYIRENPDNWATDQDNAAGLYM